MIDCDGNNSFPLTDPFDDEITVSPDEYNPTVISNSEFAVCKEKS